MADWPTLTDAKVEQPIIEQPETDPTIRSKTESGHVRTRLRFPAVPRQWQFNLRYMSDSDKTLLETFEHTTVGYGSGTFNWTHPKTSTVYVVRLGAVFQFTQDGVADLWRTPVTLVEASATQ
jgi:hypothetical protein